MLEKCFVSVQSDGSIAVRSSGLELGQGINTKVAQAVALGLLPALPSSSSPAANDDPAMRMLGRVVVDGNKSTKDFALCTPTWSSTTSESCCIAAAKACEAIVKALAPFKSSVTPGSADPWLDMVTAALAKHADLSSSGTKYPVLDGADYKVYCAAAVVAEVSQFVR